MAETDILNPQTTFWPALNDNPNPSYGYSRRSAANSVLAKTRLGAPYSRETLNQGFAFEFAYVDRPWTTMLRLKQFYEQFKGGYFTYIDYDGGGRNHVGRFTTPINPMETSNGKFTAQGIIFEEMPRARMLTYPADFVNWSRTIYTLDDYLNPTVATYSAAQGAWLSQLNPTYLNPSVTDPSKYELLNLTPAAGDFAQIEYVGWGFQMAFRVANYLGQVGVYLDDVLLIDLDLSTGAIPGGFYPPNITLVAGMLTCVQVPLDKHRVKVVATGLAGSNGNATGAIFPYVTVIV